MTPILASPDKIRVVSWRPSYSVDSLSYDVQGALTAHAHMYREITYTKRYKEDVNEIHIGLASNLRRL